MRISNGQLQLSATDVAKHLACRHVTTLDMLAVLKKIERPYWHDPGVAVLEERGLRHEAAYLQHLKDLRYDVLADDDGCHNGLRIDRTVNAMRSGAGAIAQADLQNGRWRGRADVLLRVDRTSPSLLERCRWRTVFPSCPPDPGTVHMRPTRCPPRPSRLQCDKRKLLRFAYGSQAFLCARISAGPHRATTGIGSRQSC